MSMSEGSAAQRGKAPTDVMTAVEEIGVDVRGCRRPSDQWSRSAQMRAWTRSVSQLSEELETEASLFADTPDDLAEVMSE